MSQVHKVINLKTPIKIFGGYTIKQILLLAVGLAIGIFLATKTPSNWKVAHLPAGLFVFVVTIGIAGALSFFTEVKPLPWWRNLFLYRLGFSPKVYIPKPEVPPIYPDPTIIEKVVQDEFYIESDSKPRSASG